MGGTQVVPAHRKKNRKIHYHTRYLNIIRVHIQRSKSQSKSTAEQKKRGRSSINFFLHKTQHYNQELLLNSFVALGVDQLGDNFPGMTAGVEMVGVGACFLLGPLFSRVARVKMFVVLEVVVFILVEVTFRHFVSLKKALFTIKTERCLPAVRGGGLFLSLIGVAMGSACAIETCEKSMTAVCCPGFYEQLGGKARRRCQMCENYFSFRVNL